MDFIFDLLINFFHSLKKGSPLRMKGVFRYVSKFYF